MSTISADLSQEAVVKYLAAGIEAELVRELMAKVEPTRKAFVDQVNHMFNEACMDAARGVVANVQHMTDYRTGDVHLHFTFDKKETE